MFSINDRVIYTSGRHGKSSSNPLFGTKFECEGTVIMEDKGHGFPVQVRWDNGKTNSYSATDFERVDGSCTNPNMAFSLKKRKRR